MIIGFITTLIVGIICIFLGIQNAKGNISSLHSYHRNRVSEEDVLPFGRQVGAGTIIIGSAVILMGVSMLLAEITKYEACAIVGSAVMLIGLIVGAAIAMLAMIKYNKGIF